MRLRPSQSHRRIFGVFRAQGRAGLTIGGHTNVRRGPFSRTRIQDFLICGGALFPPKVVHWTFKRQNSVVKIWQLIGGAPLQRGAPSHGTTGTMDNSALCSRAYCLNGHGGAKNRAMRAFHKICRISQSSRAHKTSTMLAMCNYGQRQCIPQRWT